MSWCSENYKQGYIITNECLVPSITDYSGRYERKKLDSHIFFCENCQRLWETEYGWRNKFIFYTKDQLPLLGKKKKICHECLGEKPKRRKYKRIDKFVYLQDKRYVVRIHRKNCKKYIGSYDTKEEAIKARDKALDI